MSKKVLVAMSGGVDSSVSALLLQQQGYDVTGVTFNLYKQKDPQHIKDAKKCADALNVPHVVMHLEELFSEKIIEYFVETYMKGNTPNPCAFCNRYIKFASLEHKANELGIPFIATGHYANLIDTPNGKRLSVSEDEKKSQEYFLALIPPSTLNKIIFPLKDLKKPQVRIIAKENHLEFFGEKPDSQEICFLQDKTYSSFIDKKIDTEPLKGGSIITHDDNKTVGQHKGFYQYTVGQRRGIGVGVGKPQYVVSTNPDTNEVLIGDKHLVEKKYLRINLLTEFDEIDEKQDYQVKIRYKSPSQECTIIHYKRDLKKLVLEADGVFFAPSNGQIAVIYQKNIVVAAGEIEASSKTLEEL